MANIFYQYATDNSNVFNATSFLIYSVELMDELFEDDAYDFSVWLTHYWDDSIRMLNTRDNRYILYVAQRFGVNPNVLYNFLYRILYWMSVDLENGIIEEVVFYLLRNDVDSINRLRSGFLGANQLNQPILPIQDDIENLNPNEPRV